MVNIIFKLALLGLSISSVLATPTPIRSAQLARRSAIDHDAVVGFPHTVPSGSLGTLYLKYKPYLYTYNGCVPYPAVDAQGNTNAGLKPTGPTNGDCTNSTGQIYSRASAYNGSYAIMYAWYWPKDEPISGDGHRHDWESTVVWLDSTKTTLLGVAASEHGNYATSRSPHLNGTSPTIEYISYFPLDHQLAFTDITGVQQPLIAWESLPTVAQVALNNTDFGDANVPFKDANFETNLGEASL